MERLFGKLNAELDRNAQATAAKPEPEKTVKDVITQILEAFEKKDYFR